jgi:hypothetical protein
MAKRIGYRYAVAAAAICGIALLILAMRAGALRAGAMEGGASGLTTASGGTGQLLQSSVAATGTVEPRGYFPILARDWFEEYSIEDGFGPPLPGWPAGSVRNVVTVREEFNYGPYEDADKSKVYQIGVRDNDDHVFLTGPLYVLKNFEYQAWMRRKSCATDQAFEYGILISPVPIDPAHPQAEDVITFQSQLGFGDKGFWWVKRWDVSSVGVADAVEKIGNDRTDALTEECNIWNVMRIERVGNTLTFKVTNQRRGIDNFQTVATYTPGPGKPLLHDQYYVGFFAAHPGVTEWRYYQYDNVYVHAYP